MDHGVQQGVDHGAVIPVASQVCPFQARVANFPVSFAVAFQVKASHVQLFVTPWTIQSLKFSRTEYWSG